MANTERYKGSARSGGIKHWYFQRWTGAILILMLLTHFFICHFVSHGAMTYDTVMERLSNPVWKAFDLVFLYLAAYHGIMGFWSVVADYKISNCLKIAVYSFAMAILSYIVIFGTVTILSLKAVGS